jgi:hypothetical protein
MADTIVDVAAEQMPALEPADHQRLAEQLLAQAEEQGVDLVVRLGC